MSGLERTLRAAGLVVAGALLAACSSDGARARRWQAAMFEDVPPGVPAKVVVLRIPDPGRITPSERALLYLRKTPGVLTARRGAGEDELYALVEADVPPELLAGTLESKGERAWVVRVVTQADLARQEQQE